MLLKYYKAHFNINFKIFQMRTVTLKQLIMLRVTVHDVSVSNLLNF